MYVMYVCMHLYYVHMYVLCMYNTMYVRMYTIIIHPTFIIYHHTL